RFLPSPIVYPETAGVKGYDDISPRVGFAYDVFGTGKTSLKVNLGRYLDAASNNNGNYPITNPTSRMAGSTELGRPAITRTWNDSFYPVGDPRRGNFVPDCDLLNPDPNAECVRALSDRNFGTDRLSNNFDPAILEGWGV